MPSPNPYRLPAEDASSHVVSGDDDEERRIALACTFAAAVAVALDACAASLGVLVAAVILTWRRAAR